MNVASQHQGGLGKKRVACLVRPGSRQSQGSRNWESNSATITPGADGTCIASARHRQQQPGQACGKGPTLVRSERNTL